MTSDSAQHIGLRLQRVFDKHGISVGQFARVANVTRGRVGQWLQGVNLTVQALTVIAAELPVSLNWLVFGEGEDAALSDIAATPEERQLIMSLRHIGVEADPVNQIVTQLDAYRSNSPSLHQASGFYPLIHSSDLGWLRTSSDGIFLEMNAMATRLLGATSCHQLVGRSVFDVVLKAYHCTVYQSMRQILQRGYGEYQHLKIQPINDGSEPVRIVTKSCLSEWNGQTVIEVIAKPRLEIEDVE